MRKTIKLALNQYPTVPESLKASSGQNSPIDELHIDVARLFHHYYP